MDHIITLASSEKKMHHMITYMISYEGSVKTMINLPLIDHSQKLFLAIYLYSMIQAHMVIRWDLIIMLSSDRQRFFFVKIEAQNSSEEQRHLMIILQQQSFSTIFWSRMKKLYSYIFFTIFLFLFTFSMKKYIFPGLITSLVLA